MVKEGSKCNMQDVRKTKKKNPSKSNAMHTEN